MFNIVDVEKNFGDSVSKEEMMTMYPEKSEKDIKTFIKSVGWKSKSVYCGKLGKNVRKWCKPDAEDAARELSNNKGHATTNDIMLACIEKGLDPEKVFGILRDAEAENQLPFDTGYAECIKIAREVADKVISQDLGEYCRFSSYEKVWIKAATLRVVIENIYPHFMEKKSYQNTVDKTVTMGARIYKQGGPFWEIIKFPCKIKLRWENDPIIEDVARYAKQFRSEHLDEAEIAEYAKKSMSGEIFKDLLDI